MRQRPWFSPVSLGLMPTLLAGAVFGPTARRSVPRPHPRVLSLSDHQRGLRHHPRRLQYGFAGQGEPTPAQATIQIKSVTLSATGTFVLTNQCGATLAPGATCGFSLQFQPQLPGSYTASSHRAR